MKKQRTSAEQRGSEDSSDEQPVFDGAAQGTFCVITHAATFIQLSDEEVKLDMPVALQVAMEGKTRCNHCVLVASGCRSRKDVAGCTERRLS